MQEKSVLTFSILKIIQEIGEKTSKNEKCKDRNIHKRKLVQY